MGFVSGKDWRTPHVVKADPWAKLHAWRFNGPISKGQNIKVPFFFFVLFLSFLKRESNSTCSLASASPLSRSRCTALPTWTRD